MLHFSCLDRIGRLQIQLLPLCKGAHALAVLHAWLSFITVIIQAHANWLSDAEKPKLYILLMFRMQPAVIALNYSIKNIRNDVCQIIYIYIYEKSQFNSLVWGSLTLAPTTTHGSQFGSDMVAYMGYAHRTGYCMYYGFCGSDSDLSRLGTTENSCARED